MLSTLCSWIKALTRDPSSGRTESVRHSPSITRTRLTVPAGSGLYGLLKFNEITGDQRAQDIALAWFKDRFEIGTTKVSFGPVRLLRLATTANPTWYRMSTQCRRS